MAQARRSAPRSRDDDIAASTADTISLVGLAATQFRSKSASCSKYKTPTRLAVSGLLLSDQAVMACAEMTGENS